MDIKIRRALGRFCGGTMVWMWGTMGLGGCAQHFTPVLEERLGALSGEREIAKFEVKDGGFLQLGPKFNPVESMAVSADSRHVAFAERAGEEWRVTVDDRPGEIFPAVGKEIVLSADGKHCAYTASAAAGQKSFVVLDGKKGALYQTCASLHMTADGKHLAYMAFDGKEVQCVVDGKAQKRYETAWDVAISSDGSRVAYAAMQNGKWMVVVNEVEGKTYDFVCASPIFSRDGKHLAFAAGYGSRQSAARPEDRMLPTLGTGKAMAVLDGVEQGVYADVFGMTFSENGTLAYVGANRFERFVVANGVQGPKCVAINGPTLVLSADGKRVAYGADLGSGWVAVIDGRTEPAGEFTRPPVFSADGRRVAYGFWKRQEPGTIVVDGKTEEAYVDNWVLRPPGEKQTIEFSPDGRHVLYADVVTHGNRAERAVVMDGKVLCWCKQVLGRIRFDGNDRIHFLNFDMEKGSVRLVEMTLP